jgi:tellurite resistance protein TerC
MDVPVWVWVALFAILTLAIVVDFLTLKGKVSLTAALVWSAAWTALGLAFTFVVADALGNTAGQEYATGYLLERSLSLDNVFVFAVIFGYFAVPAALQTRALMWGVIGALVFRAIFIVVGAGLLETFHWMIFVFGGFLVITGIRLALAKEETTDPSRNVGLRLLKRLMPTTDAYEGNKVFTRRNGILMATPMLGVLVVIATTDVIFAVDSIPAIFAVTDDPFIVFAANAFAVMGLRALYFVLADLIDRFVYLKYGLAVILVLVGAKMLGQDLYHTPAWAILVAVIIIIGGAILASFLATRGDPEGRPAH